MMTQSSFLKRIYHLLISAPFTANLEILNSCCHHWVCFFTKWVLLRVRTKHGPGVHGPPPWTGSMDHFHGRIPWTTFMDRVHGPPVMDQVHGQFFEIMRNEQKQKQCKNIKIKNNNNNKQCSIDKYYSIVLTQCEHATFTSCQNAACSYELYPLTRGLCFGGKRFD